MHFNFYSTLPSFCFMYSVPCINPIPSSGSLRSKRFPWDFVLFVLFERAEIETKNAENPTETLATYGNLHGNTKKINEYTAFKPKSMNSN